MGLVIDLCHPLDGMIFRAVLGVLFRLIDLDLCLIAISITISSFSGI